MSRELTDEEQHLVLTVREFLDRDVKPAVNATKHRDGYREKFIERMKQIGIVTR